MALQKSTGLLTLAALLGGLLLGLAIWRSPVSGQGFPFGPTVPALQALTNGGDSATGRTIAVSGNGEVRAKPDTAFVTVGVDSQAASAEEAQQDNATRTTAVIDAIKRLQIPDSDIQTSAISLQPVYDTQRPPNGVPGKILGYRAISRISVRVADITKTGSVLDEAVKAGANVEGNIRFTIMNDTQLRQDALKKATLDARGKADAIASALGVTITGVHSAGEGSISMPVLMQDEAAFPSARAAPLASMPIEPGELTITAQVRVAYSY